MARSLTAGMVTEVTAEALTPIALCEFEFPSETLYFWTGYGDLSWNGNTYTGAGNLLTIGEIEETAKMKAAGLDFELSGVPADLISIALTEEYQGRVARLYVAALDSNNQIISNPYLMFKGYMDIMDMEESGDTARFTLSVENRLIALERPNKHLYTPERQKLDYPGDLGFDTVASLQETEVVWG